MAAAAAILTPFLITSVFMYVSGAGLCSVGQQKMDLLSRKCSGTTLCHYTKIAQRAFLSLLVYKNLLPQNIRLSCFHSNKCRTRLNIVGCRQPNRLTASLPSSHSARQPNKDDPFLLIRPALDGLADSVRRALMTDCDEIQRIASYHFQDGGKLMRPSVVLLMSQLCNSHTKSKRLQPISPEQYKIALVSEMIHGASLVHDDVIDESDLRRNRSTVSARWGNKKAVLVGDFVLAKATQVLASIGNPEVITLLAQVIEDLVSGEFMQLGSRDQAEQRLMHYMQKTFKKTASLFAHSCMAAAVLAKCEETVRQAAFQYGRNVGMAFQLIDDTLDFVANSSEMGKPVVADLKLGIATAPVLFAAQQYPELDKLIARKFAEPGDVQKAWQIVLNSDGILETKQLASQFCRDAVRQLDCVADSPVKTSLADVAEMVLTRDR